MTEPSMTSPASVPPVPPVPPMPPPSADQAPTASPADSTEQGLVATEGVNEGSAEEIAEGSPNA